MKIATAEEPNITPFDVHTTQWIETGKRPSRDRPVWEYLSTVKQGSLLIGEMERFSVYGFGWDPDFRAPTHFHDIDQVQLVIDGEVHMGSRVLRPGCGVFMPAGRAYNFSTGPKGATVLEFRERGSFRTAYKPRDTAMLGKAVQAGWLAGHGTPVPPTELPGFDATASVGKVRFFDAETCPLTADDDPARPMRQDLLGPPESPKYRFTGCLMGADERVPSHSESVDRVVYSLAGELRLGSLTLRCGQGAYIGAGTSVAMESGPVGAHYVEFRNQPQWDTSWDDSGTGSTAPELA